MATAVKKCRVCGKEYEACRTMTNKSAGVFRWQEVACSPECGAEYLRRVTEVRNPAPPVSKPSKTRHRSAPIVDAVKPVESPMDEFSVKPDIQTSTETSIEMSAENE